MHRNYYLSCLVADGLDGSGLQLEKIGQFFQVVPVFFRKVTIYKITIVCSSDKKTLVFSSQCCMSNFMLKNRLSVKYLSGFDQNIAKLP